MLAMRTLNFEEGGERGAHGAGALRGDGKGSGADSVGNSAAMRMAIAMSRTVGRLLRMVVSMWMLQVLRIMAMRMMTIAQCIRGRGCEEALGQQYHGYALV